MSGSYKGLRAGRFREDPPVASQGRTTVVVETAERSEEDSEVHP